METVAEAVEAREALRAAGTIFVISGAGISTESGIPTFRGEGGWWRSLDPERLATAKAFHRDPKTVWEWYDHRRRLLAQSEPNSAHHAVALLERSGRQVLVLTQNVDDFHEQAGSTNIVHIHGLIWQVRCLRENTVSENRQVPLAEIPPRCECGGLLRPNVVWFDEELFPEDCRRVEDFLQNHRPDVVLVVGTEATFDYVRDWALRARRSGAKLIEVNTNATRLTPQADLHVQGKAGEVLGPLTAELAVQESPLTS